MKGERINPCAWGSSLVKRRIKDKVLLQHDTGPNCSAGSTLGLGTSACLGVRRKKKKKKKRMCLGKGNQVYGVHSQLARQLPGHVLEISLRLMR